MNPDNTRKTAAVQKHISDVYRLLLAGARRREIIAYANYENWGTAPRTIDRYIARAKTEIADVTEEERRSALGMALKRLDMLYNKSLNINDYKTCLAILKETNNLHGLNRYQVDHQVEISDSAELRRTIDAAIAADPDARDRIVEALGGDEEEGE